MAERIYLAMTAAEFASVSPIPPQSCWMACHFSPYGTGLANLPPPLPPDSLLILNDRIPIRGHNPEQIAGELRLVCEENACRGILLDFQKPNIRETEKLAAFLSRADLLCPVCVSALYAHAAEGPVFLPPCPHHVSLSDHAAPWQGRELWLELARDSETITLTESGSRIQASGSAAVQGFEEKNLHCHYSIETGPDFARFTLWRTREDLDALIREAIGLGVKTFVGLWQEWQ